MDRGDWQATVYGVPKSQARVSDQQTRHNGSIVRHTHIPTHTQKEIKGVAVVKKERRLSLFTVNVIT